MRMSRFLCGLLYSLNNSEKEPRWDAHAKKHKGASINYEFNLADYLFTFFNSFQKARDLNIFLKNKKRWNNNGLF